MYGTQYPSQDPDKISKSIYVFINYMQLEVSGEALMDGSSWLISRYVYMKVSWWILRVVGGGPNGVGI